MPDTTYEIFPSTGFTVTHFLVSADIKKAVDFYTRILGGRVVMDGEDGKPNVVQLANAGSSSMWEAGRPTTSRPYTSHRRGVARLSAAS